VAPGRTRHTMRDARLLIRKTAWEMDQMPQPEIEKRLSDKVSMCNYWANRLCCEAADQAMQVHGGIGYSRTRLRTHLSPPPPVPDHRGNGGNANAQGRCLLFGYVGPRREKMSQLTWDDVDYRKNRADYKLVGTANR